MFKKKKRWLVLASILGALLPIITIGSVIILLFSSEESCGTNMPDSDLTTTASMTKNGKELFDAFVKKGATPQAAAGILGVLDLESGFSPKAGTLSGSAAYGLPQWTGSGDRKARMLAYAEKHGGQSTLAGQFAAMMYEVNGDHSAAKHVFKMTDVHQACKAWLLDYEGMRGYEEQWYLEQGPSGSPGRYARADKWYVKFGGDNFNAMATTGNANSGIDQSAGNSISDGSCDTDIDGGTWGWPFSHKAMPGPDQDFGPRAGGWHDGWDLGTAVIGVNARMHAVHPGKVIFAGDPMTRGITDAFPNGLGKLVIVTKGDDGLEIIYQEYDMNGDAPAVNVGDMVKTGQIIGTVKTDHLHLGIVPKGMDWATAQHDAYTPNSKSFLDPAKFLKNAKPPKD